MEIQGSRVGVVGGSIAGCATAIAASRLGAEVTVFERSASTLRDRGSGIAVPVALREELLAAGYLPSDYPSWESRSRRWIVADGSTDGDLRWCQSSPAQMNNWGGLWRALRASVPNERYVDGALVETVQASSQGAALTLADGVTHEFDVVFGADGYRSKVRGLLHPESQPHFAGYVLWRGNFPASQLADRTEWDRVVADHSWVSVGFDGGHAVMYPIPDFDAVGAEGPLRVNWAIYAPKPVGLELDDPASIPPGAVAPDLHRQLRNVIEGCIPPRLQPLFAGGVDEVSIQPVYDELVDTYTAGRIALIGDAATLSRPHTGSGATKAIQDAMLIEALGAEHREWDPLLAAYDADRSATGRTLVELGRRIGRDQVERTPPWGSMAADEYAAWAAGTLDGEKLYFWGDTD